MQGGIDIISANAERLEFVLGGPALSLISQQVNILS